jgi:glycerol-3-phosphate acyltransferase PlsY
MSITLITAALSYLLGSIPFGYLLVRIFRGEDVRQSGSGNIGATNVSRKSPALGVITLTLDALKGAAAVLLAHFISYHIAESAQHSGQLLMAVAALFAILGHMFPLWLRFHGGKGVATALGAFLLIAPKAVLIAAGIFLIVALVFRYVSLASITAVAFFPLVAWVKHENGDSLGAMILMSLTSALIVAKHHENVERLLSGTESGIGSRRGVK